jgi:hypothetical protein
MKRRKSEKDKKLVDDARLSRWWRAWHAEQLAEALTGLHRDVMTRLMAHLKQLRSARELVELIDAQDWSAVDANTRLIALHEINTAVVRLRESQKRDPIDDALPGQPPNAFQVIRKIVNQFPAHAGRPAGVSGKHRRK